MNIFDKTAYRMKIRKEINKLPNELIIITQEECKRALERKKK